MTRVLYLLYFGQPSLKMSAASWNKLIFFGFLATFHVLVCAPQRIVGISLEPSSSASTGPNIVAVHVVPAEVARNALAAVVLSDSGNVNGTNKADITDIAKANNKTTTGIDTAPLLAAIKNETVHLPAPPLVSYSASNSTDFPWRTTRRLGKDVIPLHYDVFLHPDIDAGNFTGSVSIIVHLTQPRKFIFLHVNRLVVTSAELLRLDTRELANNNSTKNAVNVSIADLIVFEKNQFLVLSLKDEISAGRYAINMQFHGSIKDKITGFYRSSYKTKNNTMRYIATTQFQSTFAREAFPCFDEPSFKATFNISVMHSSNLTAISNMPVAEMQHSGNLILTKFMKTPPMVTYLVAFVVSDFKYIETRSVKGNIPLRAYASAEQVENGHLQFALDVLKYSVNAFEEYFGIPFQLPKLDMIAIPDTTFGAMENWGLMTFREIFILYDPKEAAVGSKHDIALEFIAHEVAHQWFGDLVTTQWWDSLWLNEGFATRIEYVGVTGFDPDWPVQETFVQKENQKALLADQLGSSHPIVVAGLQDPADIEALFDAIPYKKGACVLRMLEEFLGVETFRKGVSRYLRQHSFSTANTDDLWRALSEQASLNRSSVSKCVDIKQVMDSWTLQMNYPLVTVEGVNTTHGRIKQSRFLTDASAANQSSLYKSPYNYTWYIPVTFRALDSNVSHLMWTNTSELMFEWPIDGTKLHNDASLWPSVFKFNPAQAGFYRVNYPLSIWKVFADKLAANVNTLPDARDRVGLLGDAFELAKANIISYTVPLEFLSFVMQEHSLLVWLTANNALSFVGQRLTAVPEAYGMFRARMRELVQPALDDLGFADVGTTQQRQLRSLLLDLACDNGHAACIRFAQNMFREWLFEGRRVSPNLRAIVYTYGMMHNNDEAVWQMMLDRLSNSRTPQEKRLLLSALASSSQPWQVQHLLELSFNNSFVRINDQVSVFSRLASNPVATMYAWNYYRSNLPRLVQRLTLNHRGLGRLPLSFAGIFNDQLQLDEMKALFGKKREGILLCSFMTVSRANILTINATGVVQNTEKYPEAGAGRLARRQAVETLESNISWLTKHNATVVAWLQQQNTRKLDLLPTSLISV